MLRIIIGLIILSLVVVLILYLTGTFKSSDDKSPISKDGKKIHNLDIKQAVATCKKNGFKQNDDEIKNILALSCIFAGMKKEDEKLIVDAFEKNHKDNTMNDKKSNTKEGNENKHQTKGGSVSRADAAKIEKVNKDYKKEVFDNQDGVDKVFSEDYKNKYVKQILKNLSKVEPKGEAKELKEKVPNYDKIIKKANVSRIDKDNKEIETIAKNVLLAHVNAYEMMLQATRTGKEKGNNENDKKND